ncbi:DNA-binding protein [Teredinibacter turnerae T7901]|uniref:DNA-binding protein n=1 Tax=Teredinibacter turnerae (strain ATCC 39867 / T7901) TaxID=377629 RepID=C5BLI6_TERTT|nr:XRE family transcriptional regulator [Teredinibacter turnerae]ACR13918.1 DNA-binding protein [Teredinibacter turnerae T7901]
MKLETLARNLAGNVRQLRSERGFTQQQMATLAQIPRPTWASIESGAANPTLSVLSKLANALQVSIEELVSAPRSQAAFFAAGFGPHRKRRGGIFSPMVPELVPGVEISRLQIEPAATVQGAPHTHGTREYLTCERGKLELRLDDGSWFLLPGDAVAFRGDQKHAYVNCLHNEPSIAFSVVCFAPN